MSIHRIPPLALSLAFCTALIFIAGGCPSSSDGPAGSPSVEPPDSAVATSPEPAEPNAGLPQSPQAPLADPLPEIPASPPVPEPDTTPEPPAIDTTPEPPAIDMTPATPQAPAIAAAADVPGAAASEASDSEAAGDLVPIVKPDAEPTDTPVEAAAPPAEPSMDVLPADIPANPLRDGGTTEEVVSEADPVAAPSSDPPAEGEPFDPYEENGRFFADWPDPAVALVITGRQDGYLEPCGCAGKERMKGGLMRRHSLFEDLRTTRGWPTVGIDVGGIVKTFGRQAEMKFSTTVDAIRAMRYDAVALGGNDLKLPAEGLFAVVAHSDAQPSPFVSANVGVFGFAHGMSLTHRVVEQGGVRVGITSVLGKKAQAELNNPDIELADPEAALDALVPKIEAQCDMMVLLAHATIEESEALARKYPNFDVVVTSGGPPEPPDKPAMVEGTETMLVEVGTKGMAAVVLGVYMEPKRGIRYERVIIDSRYPDSQEIKLLMTIYQDRLRHTGLAGLGIRPAPHPGRETLGRFVGSKKCESCHEESTKVWRKSGHSDAWKTLVELDPPRTFDPECIACHVVGWHPHYYFPYESGFLSEAETPELIDVGCESCHGAGEAHVNAEMGNDKELQKQLQQAMVLTKEDAEKRQCTTCHDLDNSPDFDFETYWPKVEHHEDWGDEE